MCKMQPFPFFTKPSPLQTRAMDLLRLIAL